ncbi:MAG: hypothetical protein IJ187_05815, partial [Neisseriaceae bacterium]|nr:hypothetical protein [Neisseriaceae bacterium]
MAEKNQSQKVSGSLNDTTRQRYEQRIDELFNGSEPLRRNGVWVMQHSDMLDLLGYGSYAMSLVESKVGVSKHPLMTAEQWKKMPDWIENPIAVFKSATVANRLVFIAPEQVDNRDIVIIVEPNGNRKIANAHILLNAYERDIPINYQDWINKNLMRYVDMKKVSLIDEKGRLKLPPVLNNQTPTQVKATAKLDPILTENDLEVYRNNRQIEINQQIEQQKGNKMAQANDNTTEQQISRQELDNRLLSWSSQYIDALNNVIVAEQNSATLDERTNLVNAFYENKKQNPLLVAPD